MSAKCQANVSGRSFLISSAQLETEARLSLPSNRRMFFLAVGDSRELAMSATRRWPWTLQEKRCGEGNVNNVRIAAIRFIKGKGILNKARQPLAAAQLGFESGQNLTRTPNWICRGV